MPTGVYKRKLLAERFWEKVDVQGPDECWEWQNSKVKNGYGQIKFNDKLYLTHRISLYLESGVMPPDDMCVCHTCNNPGCVNPAHLYVGTQQDNMADMAAAGNSNKGKSYNPGESNGLAKLTENEVAAIHGLYAYSKYFTQAKLAELFWVDRTTINKIINRKLWKHVS